MPSPGQLSSNVIISYQKLLVSDIIIVVLLREKGRNKERELINDKSGQISHLDISVLF